MTPLVSILFPCYNAEQYLDYSLESILKQDYKNIEVICINDGSTDSTLTVLESYERKDSRIIIVNNKNNIGLIDSLNNSFSFIKGEFFARMDADDFCPPNRISKQVNYLLKNPESALVSSGYNYFFEDKKPLKYVAPIATLPNAIKFVSLFSTPVTHASVLGRTSLIIGGKYSYDRDFAHAEDYELFSRLAWQNVRLSNINEALYWVRLNPKSVSVIHQDIQVKTNLKIIKRNLDKFLGVKEIVTDDVFKILLNRMDKCVSKKQIKAAFSLFDTYFTLAESKLEFTEEDKIEIKNYLNLQKLNCIIQSSKIQFRSNKLKAIPFFISTLTLLNNKQITLFYKKLLNL